MCVFLYSPMFVTMFGLLLFLCARVFVSETHRVMMYGSVRRDLVVPIII